jgi:hypothetical protein
VSHDIDEMLFNVLMLTRTILLKQSSGWEKGESYSPTKSQILSETDKKKAAEIKRKSATIK